MLELRQLFYLNDEKLEFRINDSHPFVDFVGLNLMNSFPDATPVAFFLEKLRYGGAIEKLFELFDMILRSRLPSDGSPDH